MRISVPQISAALALGMAFFLTPMSEANACPGHRCPMRQCPLSKYPAGMEYQQAMQEMHSGMDIVYTGDADVDFVRGMIPHHQGAVDMARTLLEYGNDRHLKHFAHRIITAQEAEIAQMKHWLYVRGESEASPCPGLVSASAAQAESSLAFEKANEQMHHGMMVSYTGDADYDFVSGMIPHHQGAVDMAAVLLHEGVDPQLRQLAEDIFRSQSQEIALMNEWMEHHPRPAHQK